MSVCAHFLFHFNLLSLLCQVIFLLPVHLPSDLLLSLSLFPLNCSLPPIVVSYVTHLFSHLISVLSSLSFSSLTPSLVNSSPKFLSAPKPGLCKQAIPVLLPASSFLISNSILKTFVSQSELVPGLALALLLLKLVVSFPMMSGHQQ